ncbi:MAG: hypothetical protein GWP36_00445 [Bacteroidetes bacterium]|nr:hypothetical protein [Bacteroidota bacterium]
MFWLLIFWLLIFPSFMPITGFAADRTTAEASVQEGQIRVAPLSETGLLLQIRSLLKMSRAAEAYQLASSSAALYPKSVTIRLPTAFAAVESKRCYLARRHLVLVTDLTNDPQMLRRRDRLRAECDGPWRRSVTIGAIMGYRPSLLDRSRVAGIKAEIGSQLYLQCLQLPGLCNPKALFHLPVVRDSGIDIWTYVKLNQLHRTGGNWSFDVVTMIFRRQPSRSGFTGFGASLRLAAIRRIGAKYRLHLTGEQGLSSFHRGKDMSASSQSHRQYGALWSWQHNHQFVSSFKLGRLDVVSRNGRQRHQSSGYSLGFSANPDFSSWITLARKTRNTVPATVAPSSREWSLGIAMQMAWDKTKVRLRRDYVRERFNTSLIYLVRPHLVQTRRTQADISFTPDRKYKPKIVFSITDKKVSSADPLHDRSAITASVNLEMTIGGD